MVDNKTEPNVKNTYLPLFRKYRPQSFCDLVGQENLVRALTNAIELNRIANAYLFCGPRGTGKTSSARIFAKSLNCEHGPTVNPCQKCASCVDITNATGMDVIEIDAATNRGVEGAEDLIAQVHYAPISGKYKIFIIDEVHMLTPAAFNALLKTFEEPPENVIFILATTEPHKVLETIVSRCQRFDFRRITVKDIQKRLREISDIEKIKITDEALLTIARNVSGGLRDSLALLDQVSILGAKEEITKETIEELLGKVTFDVLNNLLELTVAGDIEGAIKKVNEIYSKGSEPRNLCENFIEFLRNAVLILNSKKPHDAAAIANLSAVDTDKLLEKNYDKSRIADILDKSIEFYKEIKSATNPYIWMELLIIQASRPNASPQKQACAIQVESKQATVSYTKVQQSVKTPEVKPVVAEIKPAQEEKEPQKIPETQPQPEKKEIESAKTPSVVEETPKDTQTNGADADIADIWSKIINSIESVPAKFFYSGMARVVSFDGKTVVLGFINQNVIAQAKSELKYKALIDAASRVGEFSFEFVQLSDMIKPLEIAPPKPIIAAQKEKTPQKTEPKQEIKVSNSFKQTELKQEDESPKSSTEQAFYSPKVKEMLEAFNGKIID